MKTLSKEAEESLISAAVGAMDLVDNGGMTPNAALEKLARDANWGPDMVRLAGYAYNTGRQNAQRESAENVLDKFASFPLMDPEAVINAIYPSAATVRKAAADQAIAGVSAEYLLPPSWPGMRESMTKAASMRQQAIKQAEDEKSIFDRQLPVPTATEILDKHYALRKVSEDARHAAAVAYDQLLEAIGSLGAYFQKSAHDRISFAAARFAASTYNGDAGVHLLDYVYDRNNLKEAKELTKNAALVDADSNAQPFTLIKHCLTAGRKVASCRAAEASAMTALEKQAVLQLAPLVSAPKIQKSGIAATSLLPVADRFYYDRDNVAAFLPMLAKEAAPAPEPVRPWSLLGMAKTGGALEDWAGANALELTKEKLFGEGGSNGDKVHDAYLDLDDPAHDSQIRGIQAQALISEMMNDDVIGGYGPEAVTKAYNEISQMSPRTAAQPLAMRSELRRHLQGNIEPHEVQQLGQIEKGVKDTAAPVHESLQAIPKPPTPPAPKAAVDSLLRLIPEAPNALL